MVRNDFAILILSHGRAENVRTIKLLEESGYTGKWYIILDNEDSSVDRYIELYGKEHIYVFDRIKQNSNINFDMCDNFTYKSRNTIVYARNMCFEIAKELGLKYFFEWEDDYRQLVHKKQLDSKKLKNYYVTNLDLLIDIMIEFLNSSDSIKTIAMSQCGEWIGGTGSQISVLCLKRKAMNTFLCDVDKPFTFAGRMNDDVNTYVLNGSRGELFFTFKELVITQLETQSRAGGLTDMYKDNGTYVKSFYSVMINPSSVKISTLCSKRYNSEGQHRYHHSVNYDNAVPKIISDRFRR